MGRRVGCEEGGRVGAWCTACRSTHAGRVQHFRPPPRPSVRTRPALLLTPLRLHSARPPHPPPFPAPRRRQRHRAAGPARRVQRLRAARPPRHRHRGQRPGHQRGAGVAGDGRCAVAARGDASRMAGRRERAPAGSERCHLPALPPDLPCSTRTASAACSPASPSSPSARRAGGSGVALWRRRVDRLVVSHGRQAGVRHPLSCPRPIHPFCPQAVPFFDLPEPQAVWTCGLQVRGNFTCTNGECRRCWPGWLGGRRQPLRAGARALAHRAACGDSGWVQTLLWAAPSSPTPAHPQRAPPTPPPATALWAPRVPRAPPPSPPPPRPACRVRRAAAGCSAR